MTISELKKERADMSAIVSNPHLEMAQKLVASERIKELDRQIAELNALATGGAAHLGSSGLWTSVIDAPVTTRVAPPAPKVGPYPAQQSPSQTAPPAPVSSPAQKTTVLKKKIVKETKETEEEEETEEPGGDGIDLNFCGNCGKKLVNDQKFCGSCGKKLERPKANPVKVKTSAPPKGTCSKCKYINEPDAGYCGICGTQMF